MMNEEEDAEGLSDSRSLDRMAQASVSWVRGNKRTQILPEGKCISFTSQNELSLWQKIHSCGQF